MPITNEQEFLKKKVLLTQAVQLVNQLQTHRQTLDTGKYKGSALDAWIQETKFIRQKQSIVEEGCGLTVEDVAAYALSLETLNTEKTTKTFDATYQDFQQNLALFKSHRSSKKLHPSDSKVSAEKLRKWKLLKQRWEDVLGVLRSGIIKNQDPYLDIIQDCSIDKQDREKNSMLVRVFRQAAFLFEELSHDLKPRTPKDLQSLIIEKCLKFTASGHPLFKLGQFSSSNSEILLHERLEEGGAFELTKFMAFTLTERMTRFVIDRAYAKDKMTSELGQALGEKLQGIYDLASGQLSALKDFDFNPKFQTFSVTRQIYLRIKFGIIINHCQKLLNSIARKFGFSIQSLTTHKSKWMDQFQTMMSSYHYYRHCYQIGPLSGFVIGDSASAGYGVKQGWLTIVEKKLQKKFPFEMMNWSFPGATTLQGRMKVSQPLEHYDFVFCIQGGNDILLADIELEGNDEATHASIDQVIEGLKNNWAETINTFLQKGMMSQNIFLGCSLPETLAKRLGLDQHFKYLTQSLEKALKAMVTEKGVSLITLPQALMSKAYIQEDGLHPNAAAQSVIARVVLKAIEPRVREALAVQPQLPRSSDELRGRDVLALQPPVASKLARSSGSAPTSSMISIGRNNGVLDQGKIVNGHGAVNGHMSLRGAPLPSNPMLLSYAAQRNGNQHNGYATHKPLGRQSGSFNRLRSKSE